MNRVAITGQGVISSIGKSVNEVYESLESGLSGITDLEIEDVDRLKVKSGGQIKDYDPLQFFEAREISKMDKFSQFAMIAARQAVNDSGLSFKDEILAVSSGVILGSSAGGMSTLNESYKHVFEKAKNKVHPFTIPKIMANSAASNISIAFNIRGSSFTVSSACSSSNHAMGLAYESIKNGRQKVVLTGGSESLLCFGGIKSWESLRVMSPSLCRPFSKGRNGLVHGEGASIFVFEDLQHAKKRGANIIAEVIGFSMSSDASDLIVPNVNGPERAIREVLKDAKINNERVTYINAHGTGTVSNDKIECQAIKKVFLDQSYNLKVSSTKAMHGHLIGATSAIELLSCTLAIQKGIIPPTINYLEADPDCDLDLVPNYAQETDVDCVLNNSFAFGGMNAVLAIKKFKN
ncbi:beta-ACP synthase [bacterium TMED277]|nr:MAG: beta-ACP synthase [bacterium TMED277]